MGLGAVGVVCSSETLRALELALLAVDLVGLELDMLRRRRQRRRRLARGGDLDSISDGELPRYGLVRKDLPGTGKGVRLLEVSPLSGVPGGGGGDDDDCDEEEGRYSGLQTSG